MIHRENDGGFWVFGYGSLMWKPGFDVAEARMARLGGYKRAFALVSVHYRGTPERPGLVLGLDWEPASGCTGVALRIGANEADEVRHYLAERELVSRAYFEVSHEITLLCQGSGSGPGEGESVDAICFILDRTHPQYAGGMALEDQAAVICEAAGPTGTNRDYLFNTVAHLRDLGVEDPELFELERMVRARTGA
ncbi:MAG: gamma-glutamylcyclotransferase [Alphaproteobacteria bacterium]